MNLRLIISVQGYRQCFESTIEPYSCHPVFSNICVSYAKLNTSKSPFTTPLKIFSLKKLFFVKNNSHLEINTGVFRINANLNTEKVLAIAIQYWNLDRQEKFLLAKDNGDLIEVSKVSFSKIIGTTNMIYLVNKRDWLKFNNLFNITDSRVPMKRLDSPEFLIRLKKIYPHIIKYFNLKEFEEIISVSNKSPIYHKLISRILKINKILLFVSIYGVIIFQSFTNHKLLNTAVKESYRQVRDKSSKNIDSIIKALSNDKFYNTLNFLNSKNFTEFTITIQNKNQKACAKDLVIPQDFVCYNEYSATSHTFEPLFIENIPLFIEFTSADSTAKINGKIKNYDSSGFHIFGNYYHKGSLEMIEAIINTSLIFSDTQAIIFTLYILADSNSLSQVIFLFEKTHWGSMEPLDPLIQTISISLFNFRLLKIFEIIHLLSGFFFITLFIAKVELEAFGTG